MNMYVCPKIIAQRVTGRARRSPPAYDASALLFNVISRYQSGTLATMDVDQVFWPLCNTVFASERVVVGQQSWVSVSGDPVLSALAFKERKHEVELDKDRLIGWLRPIAIDMVKLHDNVAFYNKSDDVHDESFFSDQAVKGYLDRLEAVVLQLDQSLADASHTRSGALFLKYAAQVKYFLDLLPDHMAAQQLVSRTRSYGDPFTLRLFLSPVLRGLFTTRANIRVTENVRGADAVVNIFGGEDVEYIFTYMNELVRAHYLYQVKLLANERMCTFSQEESRGVAQYVFAAQYPGFDVYNVAQNYRHDPRLLNERYGSDGRMCTVSEMLAQRDWKELLGYRLFGVIKYHRFVGLGKDHYTVLRSFMDLPQRSTPFRKKLWKAAGVSFLLYRLFAFLVSSVPVYKEAAQSKRKQVKASSEYVVPFMKNLWTRAWSPSIWNYYDLWKVYSGIDRHAFAPRAHAAMSHLGQNVDMNANGVVELHEMMQYANRITWGWSPFSARELEAARLSTKYRSISQHNPLLMELLMEYGTGLGQKELEQTFAVVNRILSQTKRLGAHLSPAEFLNGVDYIIRRRNNIPYRPTFFVSQGLGNGKALYADCDIYSFLHYAAAYERKAPVTLVHVPEHMFVRWVFGSDDHLNFETTNGLVRSDARMKKDNPCYSDCDDYMRTKSTKEVFAVFYDLTKGYQEYALQQAQYEVSYRRLAKGSVFSIVQRIFITPGVLVALGLAGAFFLGFFQWCRDFWSEDD